MVCHELWKNRKSQSATLDLDLYDKLQGRDGILNSYVEEQMPNNFTDKFVTASLIGFLAPPSGLKIPCTIEDLFESTERKYSHSTIQSELARLSKAGILNQRQVGSGVVYELQHDAFIGVLRPWRDKIFFFEKRRRVEETQVADEKSCCLYGGCNSDSLLYNMVSWTGRI